MDRRAFVVGAVAALGAPLGLEAAQGTRTPRIGYLTGNSAGAALDLEFIRGLRELGWVDGHNVSIEARYLSGRQELFPEVAAELVRRGVDVIVAWSPLAVSAAKKATSSVPIVGLSMGDPVPTGLVVTLGRPGGNVTGVANLRPALTGKWLELLRDVVPGITRVAILLNPTNLDTEDYVREVGVATRSWNADVKFFHLTDPQQFAAAYAEMNEWRPAGLVVVPDAMFWTHRQTIVDHARRRRLPAVYWSREYADVGGLLSYAPSLIDMALRASVFVDKILRGAKPADLPIEQPTKFELVINLKTANALGLTIPPSLLLRADQVIE